MKEDILIDKMMCLNKNAKKLFDGSIEKIAKTTNLTKHELFVLSFISRNGEAPSACNIVDKHGFSKAYVSSAITSLSLKRYIKLDKSNDDKRCQKIILLDRSVDIINQINESFSKCLNIIKSRIKKEELDYFVVILDKLINNIKNNKEKKNDKII